MTNLYIASGGHRDPYLTPHLKGILPRYKFEALNKKEARRLAIKLYNEEFNNPRRIWNMVPIKDLIWTIAKTY